MSVPVDKIYMMLAYVAGFVDWSSIESVAAAGTAHQGEYLGRLLVAAGEKSIRAGLPHHYSLKRVKGRALRGRIDFPQQIRTAFRGGLSLNCMSDEAGHSTITTRLVKTAAVRLLETLEVSDETACRLRHLAKTLECELVSQVTPQTLNAIRSLRVAEVHRTAAFVAWLVVSEQGFASGYDGLVYGWPSSPQQLGLLFQEFVRRRLHVACAGTAEVRSDIYAIPLNDDGGSVRGILPAFRTDAVLVNENDVIVVEVKLMPPLSAGRWSNGRPDKLRADHLSQLLTYLEHAALKHGGPVRIRGVLLYGASDSRVLARFPLGRHEVAVVSLDFRLPIDELLADVGRVADFLIRDNAIGVDLGAVTIAPDSAVPLPQLPA
jgi:5-methylcytosine-specific restriction endonuclease McrBC regulatory subunit McrC